MKTGATKRVQDLRRKIYVAAKSDKRKRFWGMYCHVIKEDFLFEAYKQAKENNGSPGIDGVTFKDIEKSGLRNFIAEIKKELENGTYRPMKNRRTEIPSQWKGQSSWHTNDQRQGGTRRTETSTRGRL